MKKIVSIIVTVAILIINTTLIVLSEDLDNSQTQEITTTVPCKVTIECDEDGSISIFDITYSGKAEIELEPGKIVPIQIKPNTGYHIVLFSINGVDYTNDALLGTANLDCGKDLYIRVLFGKKTDGISVVSDNTFGSSKKGIVNTADPIRIDTWGILFIIALAISLIVVKEIEKDNNN